MPLFGLNNSDLLTIALRTCFLNAKSIQGIKWISLLLFCVKAKTRL